MNLWDPFVIEISLELEMLSREPFQLPIEDRDLILDVNKSTENIERNILINDQLSQFSE